MQFSEPQLQATSEFVELVVTRIGKNRVVDSVTAIACTARLAGSLLFRSFNFKSQDWSPGTVVLSPEADQETPRLVVLLATALHHSNITLDKGKLTRERDWIGPQPSLSFLESLALLQDDAFEILGKHSLRLPEAAEAATLATTFMIKTSPATLDPEGGFKLAVNGFLDGSKRVPPPLRSALPSTRPPKPWFKFW